MAKPASLRRVKQRSRLPYDISFIGWDAPPIKLTKNDQTNLKKALGKQQENEAFLYFYKQQISIYVDAANTQSLMTPEKVGKRLNSTLAHAKSLSDALDEMKANDHSFIDRLFTTKFLKNSPTQSVMQFRHALALFIPNLEAAATSVNNSQKRGRMPAFPQQALSQGIALAIHLLIGKFPPLTQGGLFSKVLICALNTGNSHLAKNNQHSTGRKNVMPLMRIAKERFNQEEAEQLAVAIKEFVAKSGQP